MLKHHNAVPTLPARVVVIGALGFVGGAVIKRLRRENAITVPISRNEVDLLAADSARRLRAFLQPGDSVVAVAAIAPCKNMQMLVDNMKMTAAMVSALSDASPSHVINISSDAVYGDEQVPITERMPAAPTTLHGAMHLAREIGFQSEVKAPLAILRPSLLYGAADPHNGYGPNRFRRQANAGEEITLFGEGEERRDHVYIDDVAELVVRTVKMRSTGVLNIASGQVHSFRDIAETVVEMSPRKVSIRPTPRSGPMPHNGFRPFDPASCQSAFPDFRYTSLREGLAKAQQEMLEGA